MQDAATTVWFYGIFFLTTPAVFRDAGFADGRFFGEESGPRAGESL